MPSSGNGPSRPIGTSGGGGAPVVAWEVRKLGRGRSGPRVSADSGGAALTTTTTSTAIVPFNPGFADPKRLALGGFLAGYSGLTGDAYELDLRQYVAWCDDHDLDLFQVRRADIEEFARELERRGRARATVARRLCTVTSFYRYPEEEGLLAHSPAVHVRRPRIDYESHATGLDRNEVGALLVAAGLVAPCEHALVSLLVLNGLRVSEATGADIDRLGLERGHRTLTILRKGGKIVTIPLAPRTARAIDLAIGDCIDGPIFIGPDGSRLDRHAAGADRTARRPPGRDQQEGRPANPPICVHHRRPRGRRPAPGRPTGGIARDPRTTMRYDRARISLDRHATYIVAAFLAGAAR
jgi:integrase/recombinase XerD